MLRSRLAVGVPNGDVPFFFFFFFFFFLNGIKSQKTSFPMSGAGSDTGISSGSMTGAIIFSFLFCLFDFL